MLKAQFTQVLKQTLFKTKCPYFTVLAFKYWLQESILAGIW